MTLLARALQVPIWAYRLLVSPLWGPRCRFLPTCSAYALEALEKHGAWRGSLLALRRLSRCHPIPWLGAGHGYDPVPEAPLAPARGLPHTHGEHTCGPPATPTHPQAS